MCFQCEGLNSTSFAGWRKSQWVTSAPAQGLEDRQVTADFHRNFWQTDSLRLSHLREGTKGTFLWCWESKSRQGQQTSADTKAPARTWGTWAHPVRREVPEQVLAGESVTGQCVTGSHQLHLVPAADAVGWKLHVQFYLCTLSLFSVHWAEIKWKILLRIS